MYLKLTKKPNNRTFMQYVESYRDINSIPKQRVVEKIVCIHFLMMKRVGKYF